MWSESFTVVCELSLLLLPHTSLRNFRGVMNFSSMQASLILRKGNYAHLTLCSTSRFPQHLPTDEADIYDECHIYQALQAIPADLQVEVTESNTVA